MNTAQRPLRPDVGSANPGGDAPPLPPALRKTENIRLWVEERAPRHPLVFVGDNGEGDVEAALEPRDLRGSHHKGVGNESTMASLSSFF